MLNGLDLFSGIGGITLALSQWVRPVAYCEIDPYCQSVLLSHMQKGNLPKAPIWPDVRRLPFEELPGIDIIYGGFPCQGFSIAGIGKGLEDERSGLLTRLMPRLCSELGPRWIFLENVPAITSRGGTDVVGQLTSLGYDCKWALVSACRVGAPHRRERWFCLARQREPISDPHSERRVQGSGETLRPKREIGEYEELSYASGARRRWEAQPPFCRMDDELPFRMDRLKALGNSVVPLQARAAFQKLTGLE